MKKRIFSLALVLALCLGLAPMVSAAEDGAQLIRVVDYAVDEFVDYSITDVVSGSGWSYDGNGTLTLNGVQDEYLDFEFWYSGPLHIVLEDGTENQFCGVSHFREGGKAYSQSPLTISGGGSLVCEGIGSHGLLTINASGSLIFNGITCGPFVLNGASVAAGSLAIQTDLDMEPAFQINGGRLVIDHRTDDYYSGYYVDCLAANVSSVAGRTGLEGCIFGPGGEAYQMVAAKDFGSVVYYVCTDENGDPPLYIAIQPADDAPAPEQSPTEEPPLEELPEKAISFIDVLPHYWYYDTVIAAAEAGIIAGNDDGTFDPDGQLSWAQAVTFAVRLAQYNAGERLYGGADQTGTHWYDVYVEYALANGIIDAVSATPNAAITRGDAAVIFARVLDGAGLVNEVPDGYFTDVPAGSDAFDEIYALARAGIVDGMEPGLYGVNQGFKRSQVATIVARLAGLVPPAIIEIQPEPEPVPEPEPAPVVSEANPLCITITWDHEIGGTYRSVIANVTGTMDDGGSVIPAATEGEYYNSNGGRVGSHYNYGGGLTELFFYDLDGVFQITVDNGDDWMAHNWHLTEVNPRIEIAFPGQDPIVIDADTPEYYHRSYTGIWYFGFALDHGQLVHFNY